MKVYLAGPMSGVEGHNFPAFAEAAARLRDMGLEVVSPAEETMRLFGTLEAAQAAPWSGHLKRDLVLALDCDALVMLPGWEASPGATLERDTTGRVGILAYAYEDVVAAGYIPAGSPITPATLADRRADASGAVKADVGKTRLELLPARPLWGIAEVLTFGATKYADHNWRRGFEWSRMYGAMQRHLTAWWDGEDLDRETGKSHLWHAGCDLLFLAEYEATGTGTDDRYRRGE